MRARQTRANVSLFGIEALCRIGDPPASAASGAKGIALFRIEAAIGWILFPPLPKNRNNSDVAALECRPLP
jgi:hypothetical protein